MAELALFCPTYKRPHVLSQVAKNIEDTTSHSFTLYFGLEPEDTAGIAAATATGHKVIINPDEMGYSNTIQAMYEAAQEPLQIHINDDFEFFDRWDEVPVAMFERPDLMVVGIRQTQADTHGSAISMWRKVYIDEQSGVIDMPKRVFYPYKHNYQDTEFTQTAQKRGVWAKCDPLVINHLHPGFTGKEKDETYLKNDATVGLDEATFNSRKHLWQ